MRIKFRCKIVGQLNSEGFNALFEEARGGIRSEDKENSVDEYCGQRGVGSGSGMFLLHSGRTPFISFGCFSFFRRKRNSWRSFIRTSRILLLSVPYPTEELCNVAISFCLSLYIYIAGILCHPSTTTHLSGQVPI